LAAIGAEGAYTISSFDRPLGWLGQEHANRGGKGIGVMGWAIPICARVRPTSFGMFWRQLARKAGVTKAFPGMDGN